MRVRCRQCDYPLWTIAARSCPECGAPFRPSEYEFRRGAVRYRCPHCQQEYYGTSPSGHLEPREFDCVRCGAHIAMDEMALEPADGSGLEDSGAMARRPHPWVERGSVNVVSAWFRSVGAILTAPQQFGRSLPQGSTTRQAVTFCAVAVVGACVLAALCTTPMFLFMTAAPLGAGAGPGMGWMAAGMLAWAVASPLVISILYVAVSTGIAHGILVVTGGAKGGMGRTLQVMLYAEGAARALSVVPCLGYFCRIWWVVSASIMLSRVQGVGGGRATLATLPTLLIQILLVVVFYVLPVAPFVAGMTGVTGGATTFLGPTAGADLVVNAQANGQWPATPLHAVADGDLDGSDFLMLISPAGTSRGVAGATLSEITFGAGDANVRAAADRLAAQLPPNGAPFRLRNAVFVYRDLPIAAVTQDPSLWIAVVFPDDDPSIVRVMTGQFSYEMPRASLPTMLQMENTRRQQAGAPPLPDLTTLRDLDSPSALPEAPEGPSQ